MPVDSKIFMFEISLDIFGKKIKAILVSIKKYCMEKVLAARLKPFLLSC
jgi:hypothetical protein